MTEYSAVIELWLDADDDEGAQAIVDIAGTMVRAVPGVVQIEVEAPEQQ